MTVRAATSTPRLSLCMIVRDEEDMLPEFLKHAQGLWDELIVIDTGSVDHSRDLLQAAGATVYQQPWTEDFAIARNAALEHATGDFILSLDADEFISPKAKDQIRHVMELDEVGAATIIMRNHLPHGHYRDAHLLRLFRNSPEIRYRFPIHEEVESSLAPYLKRTKRRVVTLDGIVQHHGYTRERALERDKKQRDLAILSRCLSDDPRDLYSHYKRLELARFWNDQQLLQQAALDAENALPDVPREDLSALSFAGELLCMIAQARYIDSAALEFINRYAAAVPASAELHYFRGQLHEALGNVAAAKEEFEHCQGIASVRNLQMTGVRPLMGLCRLAMAQGELSTALAHSQQALALAPRDPEALLAMCKLKSIQNHAELDSFVQRHASDYPDAAELWHAYGEIMLDQRRAQAAVTAFEHAYELDRESNTQLQIAKALVQSGDYERARKILHPLRKQLPEAGIGVLVCELCTDQNTNLQLELNEEEADLHLRHWLVTALLSANDQTLTNIARRVPTIEHVFPWLPEALGLAA